MKSLLMMCKTGDMKPAVGTGKRPIQFCRDHYLEAFAHEFVQCRVVIPHRELGLDPEHLAIACAKTGQDVPEGIVWLDPVETNIPALIYAGFVEVVQPPAPVGKKAS